ncbi:heparan sulfate 2-O-sulfotransferase pipe-like isoform X2 [Lucilia cuprina]|uniref:heparan sulfate 2-O-sulfotransferase pipe-like isoform X2 n=1 Tax=Lucilia cuprina TaxID=7375 RepID=UPI001F065B45|nr:heparan sulfate 2-O-sulfotransferase pipe-like isoform X2 [Lucilia cuprina]
MQQLDWALQFYDMGEAHSYAMHINYIDFRSFDLPQPIYINMVRDPVERVISWYFYMRTPWRAVQRYRRVKTFHSSKFYKKDFAQCVKSKDRECLFIQDGQFRDTEASHIRQTLFFCGHHKDCEPFNSAGALQRAKQKVESEYAVVGSWEDVNVTLNVLENYIPRYFKGATQLYYDKDTGLFNEKRNVNSWKPPIDEEIKNIIRHNFTREYEFYYFCKQRLYKQYLALGNLF